MDRLGAGVELGETGDRPRVAPARRLPDGAGLAVEVLAPEAERPGQGGVAPTPPIVGIPTIGRLGRWSVVAELAEVGQPAAASGGGLQLLVGVGLAHQLAERLTPLAVIFKDRQVPGGPRRIVLDLARDLPQP